MPRLGHLINVARLYATPAADPGEMVAIPAGRLTVCDQEKGECPQKVDMKAFSIGKTEVSTARFAQCIREGACEGGHYLTYSDSEFCNLAAPGRENHPANCVDYFAARSFCKWEGKRLPTLHEWQYAARGNSQNKYPWGDEDADCSFANFHGKEGRGCGALYTRPVGSADRNASPFGILDLGGNAMEWTSTMARLPDDDPEGKTVPIAENKRTKRYHMGGSFADADHVQGIDFLCFDSAKTKTISLGLRCVSDP